MFTHEKGWSVLLKQLYSKELIKASFTLVHIPLL